MVLMRTLVLSMLMVMGCSSYFGGGGDDDELAPDAAIATPDAAECKPSLPECWELGCAVGALPVDCPRADDTSVCFCDSTIAAGWCRNTP